MQWMNDQWIRELDIMNLQTELFYRSKQAVQAHWVQYQICEYDAY